jgi:hypothetical protein
MERSPKQSKAGIGAATSAAASELATAFSHMNRIPNVLQAHIADLVGDAGRLLEETRAHASLNHTLSWNQDLRYLCVTNMAQIHELMSLADSAESSSSKRVLANVQHLSICFRYCANIWDKRITWQNDRGEEPNNPPVEIKRDHPTMLKRFMRTVAPNLRTLEVVLGDSNRDDCCEFIRNVLSSTSTTVPAFPGADDYAVVFPKLTSAIITFSTLEKRTDAFTMEKMHADKIDPVYDAHQTERMRIVAGEAGSNPSATWYVIGRQLRRLLEAVPTLVHLSVQVKQETHATHEPTHDAHFLLMTCGPSRWRNLTSLRLDGCHSLFDSGHQNNFMDLCCESFFKQGKNVWPRLKFYQNPHDRIDDGFGLQHTFPVLAGLVVRSCDFRQAGLVHTRPNFVPVSTMRFLWLAQQYNRLSWDVIASMFPCAQVMGIMAHAQEHVPVKELAMRRVHELPSDAWPHLRAFYTNVKPVAKFIRAYHFTHTAPRIQELSETQAREVKLLREQVTRTFLLSRNLSVWSSACNSHSHDSDSDDDNGVYYDDEVEDWSLDYEDDEDAEAAAAAAAEAEEEDDEAEE